MSTVETVKGNASAWRSFSEGKWQDSIDVRDFIVQNMTSYSGDESFLADATPATQKLWDRISQLSKEERERGGVWDVDTATASTITSHAPGYIDKDLETIVGVQTDAPFKRSVQPFGGIRMVVDACKAYGFEIPQELIDTFTNIRKTHNQGVFDAYTPEMRLARKTGIITGLPDAYGRGRIIGDYRRVALYGIDRLIEAKTADKALTDNVTMTDDVIREREEHSEQIRSLQELKAMAASYGYDISKPATNAKEAIQWLYFAYLAAIKEQNGAAMSIGRISTFIDIYIERDIAEGVLTEAEAQQLMDHFVMKLRIVKFLRTPDYNELFSGDPTWVTESIGGISTEGTSMVTKTSFRILHTLYTLGPSPEPNLTVLWSTQLPEAFKNIVQKFLSKQAQSNMKMTILCVLNLAMITVLRAVYLQCASVNKCNSSELVQT